MISVMREVKEVALPGAGAGVVKLPFGGTSVVFVIGYGGARLLVRWRVMVEVISSLEAGTVLVVFTEVIGKVVSDSVHSSSPQVLMVITVVEFEVTVSVIGVVTVGKIDETTGEDTGVVAGGCFEPSEVVTGAVSCGVVFGAVPLVPRGVVAVQ